MPPETRYAKSGDVSIAYQVVGEGPIDLVLVPGFVSHLDLDWDEAMSAWWGARARASASPGAARDLILMNSLIDVRHVLPAVQVPTLVLHRTGDLDAQVDEARYIAERIPGARFVSCRGTTTCPG